MSKGNVTGPAQEAPSGTPVLTEIAVPVLGPSHYLRFRGTLGDLGRRHGWNPAVWVADVDLGDDAATLCAIKVFPPGGHHLLNEVLGHALARVAGIPVPERCAIASLAWDQIPEPGHAALRAAHGDVDAVPGWVTSWTQGDVLDGRRSSAQRDMLMSALLCCHDGQRLAAFDHWVANTDRHAGNVVRVGPDRYTAIDHECIMFGPMWPEQLMEVAVTSTLIAEGRRLLPEQRYKEFSSATVRSLELIAVRVASVSALSLPGIVRSTLSDDAHAFLLETLRVRLQRERLAGLLGIVG